MRQKDFETPNVSLAHSLIDDAIDLLPSELRTKVAPDGNLDGVMRGVFEYNRYVDIFRYSSASENLGRQVAYIVTLLYADNPSKIEIPQSIYYEGFKKMEDIPTAVIEGITKSGHPAKERYNLALNILVNAWLTDFEYETHKNLPQEGVYLRDANGNLYLYEAGK